MAISGYAEIISCNMVRSEDIPEFAGRIHKEATRMTQLIEDIIHLSRLDEQSDMFPYEAVDLKGMTLEIVDTLQMVARKRGIQFHVEGDVPEIEGVQPVLYDMLYNLCDNAIKYNKEHGQVNIQMELTKENPQTVCWTVCDTGIGIPGDEQDRVFERFYRVDKSHSRETGGTGLGLSIVKHGAIIHDATVQVESEEGVGTRITLRIPMRRN